MRKTKKNEQKREKRTKKKRKKQKKKTKKTTRNGGDSLQPHLYQLRTSQHIHQSSGHGALGVWVAFGISQIAFAERNRDASQMVWYRMENEPKCDNWRNGRKNQNGLQPEVGTKTWIC